MAETKTTTIGARPEGISDQDAASNAVREMFTSIAPRYDVLNHVLSMNVGSLMVVADGSEIQAYLAA